MSEYIGTKCIVCYDYFKKDDDIVVCPECGTPYHRECYLKEGKCVNNVLHSKNQSWKSTYKKEENETGTIKCAVCGEENPENGLFCLKCGNPINKMGSQGQQTQQGGFNPFFAQAVNMTQEMNPENVYKPDTEIDGVTVKEYSDYSGSNSLYYLAHFIRFDKLKNKLSVNFSALLFPSLYFFYRKMYAQGIIYYLISMIIKIPLIYGFLQGDYFDGTFLQDALSSALSSNTLEWMVTGSNLINTFMMFSASLFANYFYFRKAKKDIIRIKSMDKSDIEKVELIKEKGGVSPRNVFIVAAFPFVALIILLVIAKFF